MFGGMFLFWCFDDNNCHNGLILFGYHTGSFQLLYVNGSLSYLQWLFVVTLMRLM